MAQLTVRNVDDETAATLTAHAAKSERSAEAEHRLILQEALRSQQRGGFFEQARARRVRLPGGEAMTTVILRDDRDRAGASTSSSKPPSRRSGSSTSREAMPCMNCGGRTLSPLPSSASRPRMYCGRWPRKALCRPMVRPSCSSFFRKPQGHGRSRSSRYDHPSSL